LSSNATSSPANPSGHFDFDTMRWSVDHLEMIDQRVLPGVVRYLPYWSAAEVSAGIRDMVVRGAPAIGCAAAYGIALEALRLQHAAPEAFERGLSAADQMLRASRPTAVNLAFALDRMQIILNNASGSVAQRAARLLQGAHDIAADDVDVNRRMGAYGAALLADGARVLTHCNAGALATFGHGTALGIVRSAIASGKRISVVADETRPFLQGARLTAWELQQDNIPVTLITDNMAGYLMRLGQIDAVIVGCDRVAANGDVANKIGTYMVAVLAQRHGIPFYVACPLSTIDRTMANGSQIQIEERPAAEVTGFGEQSWAPLGVAVRNPSFDITPADLITALVTERGVVRAPDLAGVAALFKQS
jgi:methylthioribose-1-phosphate isomerase